MRLRQIYIFIAMIAAGLAVQAVLASPATAATYETHGIATSTNLLSGSSASSITNFHYNIATLPAGSSVTIQFSNDNSNWYSAAGVLNGSTTLSTIGGADLSLSALGWSGTAFYYKMTLNSTSDQSATPTIDDIRLDYTPTSGYENVFVFDNYGNVGIGTTSPSGKLDIHGAGTTTGVNTQWSDLTGAAKVTILDNGNVGIGTTVPLSALEIGGSGNLRIGGLTANTGIYTDANKQLTSTPPATGVIGYWSKTGTNLSPAVSGDDMYLPATSLLGVAYDPATFSAGTVAAFNGNVGIGDTAPNAKLSVVGNAVIGYAAGTATTANGLAISGNVGIGTTNPNQALDVIGTIQASNLLGGALNITTDANGNIIRDPSDVRLKENIQTVTGALDKVMQLRGVTYKWKDKKAMGSQTDYGMIAQEVFAVAPELTATSASGIMGVKYTNMVGLLVNAIQQQQTKISDQGAVIADVNLKTSQNVETVQQLQKSVDDNLTVISSNFSAVDTKLALHDSQMANVNSQLASLGTEVSAINTRLTALDTQTSAIVSQVSALNGNMSLNEAEKADLESRLTAAETKLQTDQHDLVTFEKGTNDTLSSMLDTEDMLTSRVLDHEDRLKALEAKLATMTVSTNGATVAIPANVITQDASGNAILAGIFEAKEVVAGAFSVKNEKDSGAPTMGDSEIISVKVDADQDGWDDVTKVDGKSVRVKTGAVSETAKIFVSFENDPGARYWVEKIRDADKKLTDSFSINVSDPVKKDTKFSWWIVEEK